MTAPVEYDDPPFPSSSENFSGGPLFFFSKIIEMTPASKKKRTTEKEGKVSISFCEVRYNTLEFNSPPKKVNIWQIKLSAIKAMWSSANSLFGRRFRCLLLAIIKRKNSLVIPLYTQYFLPAPPPTPDEKWTVPRRGEVNSIFALILI